MAEGVKDAEPELRGFKSPYYREITPDYVYGGVRPGYVEMIIVTTKSSAIEAVINKKDVFEHTEEASLKMPPQQVKSLIIWMLQTIKLYEDMFGKVKSIEETDTDITKQEISKKVDDLLASL